MGKVKIQESGFMLKIIAKVFFKFIKKVKMVKVIILVQDIILQILI